MMKMIKKYVKDFVIITDGSKGAYAYDGNDFYAMDRGVVRNLGMLPFSLV